MWGGRCPPNSDFSLIFRIIIRGDIKKAFSKALYYPWIEIQDESWLKNAMLYWDEIQTIVPRSIKKPYKNKIAKAFFNEGLLIPFYVHPDLEDSMS